MKTLSPHELFDVADTLVVCATSRLAQALRHQQAEQKIQSGADRWRTVHAVTFDQWFGACHEEISLQGLSSADAIHAVVMDNLQAQIVWERVILEDLGDAALHIFDVSALAKTAMEAHELCVVWGVHPPADLLTEESRRFLKWQVNFLAQCQRQGWIDSPSLQHALINELTDCFGSLRWPGRVVFAGFTRLNPLEEAFKALLESKGIETSTLKLGCAVQPEAAHARSYPDAAAEALAAALWAKAALSANPLARLAIVVPDVGGSRHLLHDALDDVFMPWAISPSQAESARPFNISLGQPLAAYPLVHTALALLRLVSDVNPVAQAAFSHLLLSPYWSQAVGESDARGLLEAALRKRIGPCSPLASFLNDVRKQMGATHSAPLQAPQLLKNLTSLVDAHQHLDASRLPSEWAREIPVLLRRVGWLQQRQLSSHEFQTKQAFLKSIAQLGRLDDFLGPVGLNQMTSYLNRQCEAQTFQPQTQGRPQIQVLGLLETSGLSFDGAWIMGMVDTAWPPAARPNALLPSVVQRECQSPNASATVQLAFARTLQDHLVSCAQQVIFSWPRKKGDAELSPSSLLPTTSDSQHLPSPASPHWTWALAADPTVYLAEPLEDALAPPMSSGQKVSGGTWLLRAQAICPAWAFYQFRLGAGKLEEPVEGLDARKRGTFLHGAMEHFWKGVRTSAQLQTLSTAQRNACVVEAVDHVLAMYNQDVRNEPLKPRFAELERARLIRLVLGWLELELERPNAFEVLHMEKECKVDIEGIKVRMFVDRIDQLEDGSLLVIDYKTGAAIDTKNWASLRLTEPQLPIYAAIEPSVEGPVQGVVFAKVLMRDPTWSGLTCQDKVLPKVTALDSKAGRKLFPEDRFPTWDSVLAHWDERIRAVAEEIQAGDAGVRFNDEKTLQYCDVKPLLRLTERQAQLEAALAQQSTTRQEKGTGA